MYRGFNPSGLDKNPVSQSCESDESLFEGDARSLRALDEFLGCVYRAEDIGERLEELTQYIALTELSHTRTTPEHQVLHTGHE